MKYEIKAEMNLRSVIEEARELSRVIYEFADNLERIEKKYDEENYELIDLGNGRFETRYKSESEELHG